MPRRRLRLQAFLAPVPSEANTGWGWCRRAPGSTLESLSAAAFEAQPNRKATCAALVSLIRKDCQDICGKRRTPAVNLQGDSMSELVKTLGMPDALLEQLRKDYRNPEDVLGPDELMREQKMRLIEKALGARSCPQSTRLTPIAGRAHAVLDLHSSRALADLRRISRSLCFLRHGSILSGVGASGKPGAVKSPPHCGPGKSGSPNELFRGHRRIRSRRRFQRARRRELASGANGLWRDDGGALS